MQTRRIFYEIRLDEDGWGLYQQGSEKRLQWSGNKASFVKSVSGDLLNAQKYLGICSELIIKTRSGGISKDRRTYGRDPRRTKG